MTSADSDDRIDDTVATFPAVCSSEFLWRVIGISTLGQLLLLLRNGGLVERPLRDSFLARAVGSSITVEPRVGLMLREDARVLAREEGENRGEEKRGLEEVLRRGLIGTENGVVFVTMGGMSGGTVPSTGADAAGDKSVANRFVSSFVSSFIMSFVSLLLSSSRSRAESSRVSWIVLLFVSNGGKLSLRPPLRVSRLLYLAMDLWGWPDPTARLSRSSGAMCSKDDIVVAMWQAHFAACGGQTFGKAFFLVEESPGRWAGSTGSTGV